MNEENVKMNSKEKFTNQIFGSVLAQPSRNLDGEVSGSSPGHTNDFKHGTYCSSAFARNHCRSFFLLISITGEIICQCDLPRIKN